MNQNNSLFEEGIYRSVLENAPDGILVVNKTGTIVLTNSVAEKIFGYPNNGLTGLSVEELLPTQLREKHIHLRSAYMNNPETRPMGIGIELKGKKFDRTELPLEISLSSTQLHNEQCIVCIVRDISERKQIREIVSKLSAAVEQTADCVIVTDKNGVIQYVNNAFTEITGFERAEVIGNTPAILKSGLHPKEFYEGMWQTILEGNVFRSTIINKRKNGELLIEEKTITPIKDGEGTITHFVSTAKDITVQKRAEEELRKREAQYRTLLREVNEIVYALRINDDPMHESVEFVSDHVEELTGYSPIEFVRNSALWYELIHPLDRIKLMTDTIALREQKQPITRYYRIRNHKTDQYRWIEDRAVPQFDETKTLIGIFGVARDVTEKKQLDDAFLAIREHVSGKTGIEFFQLLVILLTKTLEVDYAFVAELKQQNQNQLRTIAVSKLDAFAENFECSIENTPCAEVVERKQTICYHEEVQKLFPNDSLLQSLHVESYVGLPLLSTGGETQGVLVILHSKPLPKSDFIISILKMFAIRAAAELERKQSEDFLRKQEELFRALVENSLDAIAMINVEGKFTYTSASVESILGYTIQEFIGHSVFDFIHADDLPSVDNLFSEILSEPGKTITAEARMLHKNGTIKWIEGIGRNFLHDPNVQAVVVNYRDVTERRKAERALSESEERYRKFFDEDLTGDYISTPDGKLLACNPAFVRIFGYESVSDALSSGVQSIWKSWDDRTTLIEDIKKKKKIEYHELEYKRKDGSSVFVVENIIGIFDGKGELVQIKGYLFDDTRRRKLEEQLRQAQKMEGIGTLAGGIAHDFNNILTIIIGFANIILREKEQHDPDKLSKNADTILKAAFRGANLVRQILTFARKHETRFEPISVNSEIEELGKMLSQTFSKLITFSFNLNHDISYINADKTQLNQALLNLCVNARDAMPDGGTITIKTETIHRHQILNKFSNAVAKQYVRISVSDTGNGMDDATQKRVFEPFFTTKEQGQGTGLGLSVVWGVMISHEGFVDVTSKLNEGTSFRLYFPSCEKQSGEQEIPEEQLHIKGENETLLIVEDEDALRMLLQLSLERTGYHVVTAVDGEDGLNKYLQLREKISLVITDHGMPKLDGFNLSLKLKEVNPQVNIILASGYVEPDARVKFSNSGITNIIQKPYDMSHLLKQIRETITKSSG